MSGFEPASPCSRSRTDTLRTVKPRSPVRSRTREDVIQGCSFRLCRNPSLESSTHVPKGRCAIRLRYRSTSMFARLHALVRHLLRAFHYIKRHRSLEQRQEGAPNAFPNEIEVQYPGKSGKEHPQMQIA